MQATTSQLSQGSTNIEEGNKEKAAETIDRFKDKDESKLVGPIAQGIVISDQDSKASRAQIPLRKRLSDHSLSQSAADESGVATPLHVFNSTLGQDQKDLQRPKLEAVNKPTAIIPKEHQLLMTGSQFSPQLKSPRSPAKKPLAVNEDAPIIIGEKVGKI